MKTTLQIGELSAAPGTKVSGFINVPNTSIRMPLTLVNGTGEGQTLLITAGIPGSVCWPESQPGFLSRSFTE